MSRIHQVTLGYSGGGPNSLGVTNVHEGESETDFNAACNGSATTSLIPSLIFDPTADCQCYVMLATGGNVTVHFDGLSNDATIALVDSVPQIRETNGTTCGELPSGSDTYTVRVRNANSSSITFEGRFLWEP